MVHGEGLAIQCDGARAGTGASIGIDAVVDRAVAAGAASGMNPTVGRGCRPGASGRRRHVEAAVGGGGSAGEGRGENGERTNLLLLFLLGSALSAGLLLRLALLQESLGNENIVMGRDGSKRDRLVRSPTYRSMW